MRNREGEGDRKRNKEGACAFNNFGFPAGLWPFSLQSRFRMCANMRD